MPAKTRPGWWQRRRMDAAHVWHLLCLGFNPPAPRFCSARHYTDRVHHCHGFHGHEGPHRDDMTTWEADHA